MYSFQTVFLKSTRLDRLGTDHQRYRDPTYISPRPAEIVILDTENQKMTPLFKTKVQAHSLTWSPDGKTLAFFLFKEDRYRLHTFDREQGKLKEIGLKSQKFIASNSFLIWSNDGSRIFLALRANDARSNANI
jgi:Tol biopolymer transport system component